MNRIALVVGINYYSDVCIPNLSCCENDAKEVAGLLRFNGNKARTRNFDCDVEIACDERSKVNRAVLRDKVEALFSSKAEVALFYFAGHGYVDTYGGYINGSDSVRGDDGLSFSEILGFANCSPARHKIVILDSCHSGSAGQFAMNKEISAIGEGVTILTSSRESEASMEIDGHGVFTGLLIDALNGAAANLTGKITPGSVYAHIDQSLGLWDQRPVFKTNTDGFVSLREVEPAIPLNDLRKLKDLFPSKGYYFKLDPSYESRDEGRTPDMPPADRDNNKTFSLLQAFNRQGLLAPVDADHMWNAAMESKGCQLTLLGEYYRSLAEQDRI